MAALAEGRIESRLQFQHELADVETLNQWASTGRFDVTKLSFMALGRVGSLYRLLPCGAALGWGCGPLLVGRPGTTPRQLDRGIVASPGRLTTAALLLSLYLGKEPHFRPMVFSEVMPAVARGEADYGLVIHEGRFTLASYGLESLVDLGAWWEGETSLPIPLGCFAIRREFSCETVEEVNRAMRASLTDALDAPHRAVNYVRFHAQEMDPDVIDRHINLYVNSFTLDLSEKGREAVDVLFSRAKRAGFMAHSTRP
jgi:1,4-dihydroxy-6-naphthoate synthase